MKQMEELFQSLAREPGDRIATRAAELLSAPLDWADLARRYVESISDADFVARVLSRQNAANVEPRVFLIYQHAGLFQVTLHHFDRPCFDRYVVEKRIGPHYHHFPFSTRILTGGYYQWLFRNRATLAEPDLQFERQVVVQAADIYTLPYDRFHCVMKPAHDSMSLMIRGPKVFDPHHTEEEGYGREQILPRRDRVLDLLRAASGHAEAGRLLSC